MTVNSSSGLSLFDLLAREWSLDESIEQIEFNDDDTAAAFKLAGGEIFLAATKDSESPKVRTRMELDTGRTTIRPRENPIAPLKPAGIRTRADLPLIRSGSQGFAAVDCDGTLQHITAGGQVVPKLKQTGGPVTALCSSTGGGTIAIARQNRITFAASSELDSGTETILDHSVTCLSISPDGRTAAAWGDGILSLINPDSPQERPAFFACEGPVTGISWQASGRRLACASSGNFFYIADLHSGTLQRVEGYPSPVRTTAFSEPGNALVTSGAYRLAGWDSRDLPQNDQDGTPLTTGKPGFVVLNTIAAHPQRNLVATGYASGLVTLASIGTPQDMMLHQERETEVSCLCWSKTGEHLAIGFASGKAALATFPSQMFK